MSSQKNDKAQPHEQFRPSISGAAGDQAVFGSDGGTGTVSIAQTHLIRTVNVKLASQADSSIVEDHAETDSEEKLVIDTTGGRIVMLDGESFSQENMTTPKAEEALDADAAPAPDLAVTPTQATLQLKQTLRSGQAITHSGNIVLIGDVNAGAEVTAGGDITIWGALRGIAHAGLGGNTDAEIRALKLDPIQIRIANAIARSPDQSLIRENIAAGPETARLVDGQIRITRSYFE
jgi:septum site-determining protein MinC